MTKFLLRRSKAEDMTARTNAALVKKVLANPEPLALAPPRTSRLPRAHVGSRPRSVGSYMSEERLSQALGTRTISNGETRTPGFLKEVTDGRRDQKQNPRAAGQHRIMSIATLRPDGWPQTTTVSYVNEGLTLYFLCGLDSQKAANLARDDRVSVTIDHDTSQVMEITGLSMAAHAASHLI